MRSIRNRLFEKKSVSSGLVCIVFACTNLPAQTVYIPTSHWSYEFVERLETSGVIAIALDGARPLTRRDMAELLGPIINKQDAIPQLTPTDRRLLDALRREFREEFKASRDGEQPTDGHFLSEYPLHRAFVSRLPFGVFGNGRDFFSVSSRGASLHVNPVSTYQLTRSAPDTLDRPARVFENGNGVRMWGRLSSWLGFYFDFRDTKEWGTRSYPDRFNISIAPHGFVNGYGSYIYHDETRAYLVADIDRIRVQFGKDRNQWGPGRFGGLALSDYATSYDFLKLQTRGYRRFRFTFLLAQLRRYPAPEVGSPNRYLAAHRLEAYLGRGLHLGLSEAVIYSGRGVEPGYWNPVNFYRSQEHHLGDRDNAVFSLDFKWVSPWRAKAYGELFIDDLFIARLGTGWHGNKAAFLAGLFIADPFRLRDSNLRLEYARIEPFVYTHKFPGTEYRHFLTSLGHRIGPNSDELRLEVSHRPHRFVRLMAGAFMQRHGASTTEMSAGGELDRPHTAEDPDVVHFLDGERDRRTGWSAECAYELFRETWLDLGARRITARNLMLPGGGRGPVRDFELWLAFRMEL